MTEPLDPARKIPAAPLKAPADGGEDVLAEGLRRFKQIVDREEESRILGLEDLVFIDEEGGSYESEVGFLSGDIRENAADDDSPPAPRYQVDMISPVIEQAVSDQRESEISILYRAVGNKINSKLADTMNGLAKNIEDVSDAADAYDNAYDECQKSGYGGWQIVTEYSDDSFEQDIFILPIQNATQSLFFGPSKKADKSDSMYAFHIWDMDTEEYKAQYPNATETDFNADMLTAYNKGWWNACEGLVRVAAYWRKRPVKKRIYMMVSGRVIHEEDLEAARSEGDSVALDTTGEEVSRMTDTYEVERFIMSGFEVLKGPQKWAGKYIPLIPIYGIRSVVNGREIIRGRVRKGKDPSRIYNYTTSAIVESAAKSSLDFHWVTPDQADGYEKSYENMGVDRGHVYYYNPDEKAPGPPQKAQGPTVQQALIGQAMQAREDIKATVGAPMGPNDGTAADMRSGEAIMQGNMGREKGNGIYFSNYIRGIRYTGVQLADLMSKLWTTEQQRRIMQPDGNEDFVTINQNSGYLDENGTVVIVNDITQTQFDVKVDVGPAFASQRQQGAEMLKQLATENAAFAGRPDLIAKNLDIPGSHELYKSLRRDLIMTGKVEPTEEEREEFQIDQRQQIMAELEPQIREQVLNEANIRLINAEAGLSEARTIESNAKVAEKEGEAGERAVNIEKTMAETDRIQIQTIMDAIESQNKMMESFLHKIEAGLPVGIQDVDNMNSQADIVEETQQEMSPGPNSAQNTEFGLDSPSGSGIEQM